MCKIYIIDLIQKKGAVPACENNIEFKKCEHVLKWSQAVCGEGFTRFYFVIIFTFL